MTARNIAADLDAMLERAFAEFHAGLVKCRGSWFGKEHDCVNRFVMGHLVPLSLTGKYIVKAPAQIGMEVSVYQPEDFRRRKTAHKDVVIWREASETCWDADLSPVGTPLAVIEWKVRHPKAKKKTLEQATKHDRGWLGDFTKENEGTLGYSVYLEWTSKWAPRQLVVARCMAGIWNYEWFIRS